MKSGFFMHKGWLLHFADHNLLIVLSKKRFYHQMVCDCGEEWL